MKHSHHRNCKPVERVWAVMVDGCGFITRIFRNKSDAIDYIAKLTGKSSEYIAEKLKEDRHASFGYYDEIFGKCYNFVTLESYEVE